MDILTQLQQPQIYKINRLDAHSDHKFYSTLQNMQNDNDTLHTSLNGMWRVKYSKRLCDRPAEFYRDDFPLTDFSDIAVPGHAELQGFGDIQYVNTQYPWDGKADLAPPSIDVNDSPVLSYVRFFDLPSDYKDKRVCINFNGVEQAFSLYLNGEYIGFAQDTFTPSHFDLTPYIKERDNRLCVEVYKRTCFGWIEDQDFFRFCGIFRDVTLYAKPQVHVEDLFVIPTVDESLSYGELTVKVKLSGTDKPRLGVTLIHPDGGTVFDDEPTFIAVSTPSIEPAENEGTYLVAPVIPVKSVELWDKYCPNLYTLVLKVYDDNGDVSEYVCQPIGFRRFEKKGTVLYLNGKKLIINGVNRHEWHAAKGRAISAEDMRADIEVFKRNNIDSTRTSHYPNNSLWYELCDTNGITVMDEVNMESHGTWQRNNQVFVKDNVPGSIPQWRDVTIDRAVSMFERDKNHPSILFWSCGNESYVGDNLLAMSEYFRRKDPSRVVHYEGCFHNMEFGAISDVESRMYAYPAEVEEYVAHSPAKPFLLCEFMHNMGNSIGGFESYINLYKYDAYHGGYIWDYMDQALYTTVRGERVLGYGGDFGERPTDYNFSGNGIVFADRTEKPAMQEVRFWYQSPEKRAEHLSKNDPLCVATPVPPCKKQVQLIEGNLHYGVVGKGFKILFSTVKGGPVSMNFGGHEWLQSAIKPTYWRAPTENDSFNDFTQLSGGWSAADRYSVSTDMSAKMQGECAVIAYTYDTLQGNTSTVTYTVDGYGSMSVEAVFNGKEGLPQLPLFGLQMVTPEPLERFNYVGYSGETYPDRYKGGVYGTHSAFVSEQLPPYLVPQECGCHSYSKAFTLQGKNGHRLCFTAEQDFHFSVLPYSTAQLEEAWHKYELPAVTRTYVRVLAAMRGVGGIQTWGADVEPQYHVDATKDIVLRFEVRGF